MIEILIESFRALNELLTAGIAITAFSLLLYALSFNLRDRVARTFAVILICVVFVFVGDAIGSSASNPAQMSFWFRWQWVGIIFLPSAYFHFSDALLATTGRPSRGRRRRFVWLNYLISTAFLIALPVDLLVGPLVVNVAPAPHLERSWLTLVFSIFYAVVMFVAGINFIRALQRTLTRTSRRRMQYLIAGALAPALGSYPYLLFGSGLATRHELIFWLAATASNILVSVLLIIMAYAVAFFGVPWPDRVVKRRLFKWLMRGPVTASTVLAIVTVMRRVGDNFGIPYETAIPILMVATVLVMEHLITLAAPVWERWIFHGGDREEIDLVQTLEERLLTSSDLREFLESVLAAACDRLQVSAGFIVSLGSQGLAMIVTVGDENPFDQDSIPEGILEVVTGNGEATRKEVAPRDTVPARNGGAGVKPTSEQRLFSWGDYWLVPLYNQGGTDRNLLGILGAARANEQPPEHEHVEALLLLAQRAALALEDRISQQQVFTSLEALTPQVDLIQRLRAAARYDGTEVLTAPELSLDHRNLPKWVKDALTHYWGGPKLSQSPLIRLRIVQRALEEHEGNTTNALRSILRQAIEWTRPEGERRFTAEWILYNILEMKFMEGRKVREVARKLAMSEADLYRKQRVAIEAVAKAIVEMERQAREEHTSEKIVQKI